MYGVGEVGSPPVYDSCYKTRPKVSRGHSPLGRERWGWGSHRRSIKEEVTEKGQGKRGGVKGGSRR